MAPMTSADVLGIRVLIVTIVFTVLATLAVCGRLWARRLKKISLAANDIIIIIALVRVPLLHRSVSWFDLPLLMSRS